MRTYKVAVEWAVFAEVEVRADSMEDAIMQVEIDYGMVPDEGSYIDGSLMINHEMTSFLNKKELS